VTASAVTRLGPPANRLGYAAHRPPAQDPGGAAARGVWLRRALTIVRRCRDRDARPGEHENLLAVTVTVRSRNGIDRARVKLATLSQPGILSIPAKRIVPESRLQLIYTS